MSLDVTLFMKIDTGGEDPYEVELFSANYTHNCGKRARGAGIYEYVWRPDELDHVKVAGDLIEPLKSGIKLMEDSPERFELLNPENGWGSYDSFLPWLKRYLDACIRHPKAEIHACR